MKRFVFAATAVLTLVVPGAAWAQLFTENFEVDPTADWVMNGGPVDEPGTGNTDGDNRAFFFFDYSTVGIPKAPNSAPADGTLGMKLQTNIDANNDGISTTALVTGMSVSPVGLDLSSAGDYKLTADVWANFNGPFPAGGSGSTNLATFGIQTSGTFPNYPGSADGIWFGATGDGGSTADYRAYSQERVVSYQHPPVTAEDMHATYHAASRNAAATLYADNFGNVTAPQAQIDLYPNQTGTTQPGAFGMEWHEVEIAKIGNTVTWKADGVLLITLDTTDIVVAPGGGNILFGHSDINQTASLDENRFAMLFTLIDNVKVEEVTAGLTGDHNGDGKVDAADYVLWRSDPASYGGDPQGYDDWVANFGAMAGSGGGSLAAGGAVPEPGTFAIALIVLLPMGVVCRRRA